MTGSSRISPGSGRRRTLHQLREAMSDAPSVGRRERNHVASAKCEVHRLDCFVYRVNLEAAQAHIFMPNPRELRDRTLLGECNLG